MPKVTILKDELVEGTLPEVCVVCGAPASERRFSGVVAPSLVWLLVSPLIGLLAFWAYVLVAGVTTGQSLGGFPFCSRHRNYWTRRGWFIVAGFVLAVITFVAGALLTPTTRPGAEATPHWLFGVAGCWLLVYLPAFLVLHLCATRPIGNSEQTVILSGASRGFVEALESQKIERIQRVQDGKRDDSSIPRESGSQDDHIQNAEDAVTIKPSPAILEGIDSFPLSRPTTIGCAIPFIAAIAITSALLVLVPKIPGLIFYPILVLIFCLILVIKRSSRLVLHVHTRTLGIGPFWARTKVPFNDIRAVQFLCVIDNKKAPYEVNIVFESRPRVHFGAMKNKLEAENTARAVSDLVKAPLVEQVASTHRNKSPA